MTVHNRATDEMRATVLAALQNRPVLDPHDLKSAQTIVDNLVDWSREAYRLVRPRGEMAELVQRAGGLLVCLQRQLAEEAERKRAGP